MSRGGRSNVLRSGKNAPSVFANGATVAIIDSQGIEINRLVDIEAMRLPNRSGDVCDVSLSIRSKTSSTWKFIRPIYRTELILAAFKIVCKRNQSWEQRSWGRCGLSQRTHMLDTQVSKGVLNIAKRKGQQNVVEVLHRRWIIGLTLTWPKQYRRFDEYFSTIFATAEG